MFLNLDLYLLGLCALAFVWRIHVERKAHDRELAEKRGRYWRPDL